MRKDGAPDIAAGRLAPAEYRREFRRSRAAARRRAEALVDANRCYFCYDAPCIEACPTGIDIPFHPQDRHRQSEGRGGRPSSSENIFGGMCARVCPTETLCEGPACAMLAEDKPVNIGALQRYATDHLFEAGSQPFQRGARHGQARRRRRRRPGRPRLRPSPRHARPRRRHLRGAGQARRPQRIRHRRLQDAGRFRPGRGRIHPVDRRHRGAHGKALGRDFTLAELRRDFDAVFLGMGLAGVNALGGRGRGPGRASRTPSPTSPAAPGRGQSTLPVGRRVVVIGGGMTAIDIAVQTKRLGAEDVTIVYRRGPEPDERQRPRAGLRPDQRRQDQALGPAAAAHLTESRQVAAVEFEYTRLEGRPAGRHRRALHADADMVFKAIGQTLLPDPLPSRTAGCCWRCSTGRIASMPSTPPRCPVSGPAATASPAGHDLTVRRVRGRQARRRSDRPRSRQTVTISQRVGGSHG